MAGEKNNVIDDGLIAMLESRDLHINNPMNGLFGGNRRSRSYGSSVEFADFREYTRGDDLRRIDWNLYGRFEKLYMRLFVDERQLHHRIYIDGSSSMDWGKPNKSHLALKLAAAIGFLSVQAMDRVSFYIIEGKKCSQIGSTVVGKEAFYNAANLLNGLRFRGQSHISEALCSQYDVGKDDGISYIISDFLTDIDWKSGVDYLAHNKREVQLIQILSRDEVTPGLSGKVFMLDSEAMGEDDGKNMRHEITRSSMKAYEEALLYHQNDIKQFANSRNANFLTLCSDESIERILFLRATEGGLIQ